MADVEENIPVVESVEKDSKMDVADKIDESTEKKSEENGKDEKSNVETPTESVKSPVKSDADAPISKLEKDIIHQIEYYFGDANLARDKFLLEQIGKEEGWVPMTVLLTFKRLSSLSEDAAVIVNALEKSNEGLIEISEDRSKIRRHPERPVPEQNEEHRKEVQSRTVYIKGFPVDSEMSDLIEFFKPFERVTNIVMRKYHDKISKTYLFKGSVLLTFSKTEESEAFLKKKVEYRDATLITKSLEKYNEEKKEEEVTSRRDKKKNKKNNDETKFTLPKGAVLHLEGFSDGMNREDIKEVFAELGGGDIAYIEFNRGDTAAFIRFTEENTAKPIFDKFVDGKLKIKEDELTGRVLEGTEEESFLKNVIENMKQRRNNSNRGRRGGGGGKFQYGNNRKRRGGSDDEEPPTKQ